MSELKKFNGFNATEFLVGTGEAFFGNRFDAQAV
jgi:hypothetical protein